MKKLMTAMAAAAVMVSAARAQEDVDPRKRDAVGKLNGLKVTVDFADTTVRAAIDYLRDLSGLNFHIDAACNDKADEKITLKVKDLSLKTVVKLLLTPKELTAVWRDGVMVVMPKGGVSSATTVQVYDVRDLMLRVGDFPGPKVELSSNPAQGPTITVGWDPEPPKPQFEEDLLMELVKGNTGGGSWENPACSITYANGMLIVSQGTSSHREIADFLNKLRQMR